MDADQALSSARPGPSGQADTEPAGPERAEPGHSPERDQPPRRDQTAGPSQPAKRGQTAKRQAITKAATAVFLREGFGDATIDAIAAEAGVAKQTIYNHFGDKDQLFRAVMAEAQREIGAGADLSTFEDWLADSDDLRADLRAFGRAALANTMRPEIAALRRLIIAEWNRHPELMLEWARPRTAIHESLTRAVHRQAQRGRLEAPDPALAARQLIMVTMDEAAVRSLFGLRPLGDEEAGQIVNTGVDMWLRAHRYRDPAGPPTAPPGTAAPRVESGLAEADGARLYYERRGDGPPLLLIVGGGGDAGYYSAMAGLLADRYTVLTYDRRDNSRSPLSGAPTPISLAGQSADAIAVLRANGFSSALVFGNSGGATIALDLAARHPEAVQTVVAHEPPIPRVLSGADEYLAIYDEIDRLLETEGWQAAFTHFQLEVGQIPAGQQDQIMTILLHPETAIPPGPLRETMTRVSRNWPYLTKYEIRPFIDYQPDLGRIARNPVRTVLGYGARTKDPIVIRMSTVAAERIGAECVRFPGAHTAPMDMPVAFAAELRRVLAQPAAGSTGHVPGQPEEQP